MKCRYAVLFALLVLTAGCGRAKTLPEPGATTRSGAPEKRPLVVLLVVDQFSQTLFQHLRSSFSDSGFLRLAQRGVEFTQHFFHTMVTSTAPGHALLVTGLYPRDHGIISNKWFDRKTNSWIRANVSDETPSPDNLQTTTVGDELIKQRPNAKVVSIGTKARVAAIMGGKTGAFYFYNTQDAKFATSQPSAWFTKWSDQWASARFAGKCWDKADGWASRKYARRDDAAFELPPAGFPNTLPWCMPNDPEAPDYGYALRFTPWQVQQAFDLAKTTIVQHQMGADETPDLLLLGIGTLDLVGHTVGPYSVEAHELMVDMDRQLGDFLQFLEEQIGKDVTVLVTGDHGAPPAPLWRREQGLSGGYVTEANISKKIQPTLPKGWEVKSYRGHVYLTPPRDKRGVPHNVPEPELAAAQRKSCQALADLEGIEACFTRADVVANAIKQEPYAEYLQQDLHRERSGDLFLVLKPYYIAEGTPGEIVCNHGTPHEYDRHVLMLMNGRGVAPNVHKTPTKAASVAATLADRLGIQWTRGSPTLPY